MLHYYNGVAFPQERPPPVPPSRPYTVAGSLKLGYPQTRMMKMNFPELSEGSHELILHKGDAVLVVGASPRRGHLVVEHNTTTLHVPYQYMELVKTSTPIHPATNSSIPSATLNL